MGNQPLQAAFKPYRKARGAVAEAPVLTSEALLMHEAAIVSQLAKYVRSTMLVSGDLSGEALLESNQQANVADGEDGESSDLRQARKGLAEANAGFVCGFKTAESNIEDLVQPVHEKFFEVPESASSQIDFNKVQHDKIQILYGLFQLRQKSSASTQQPFAEYAQKFLQAGAGGAAKSGRPGSQGEALPAGTSAQV